MGTMIKSLNSTENEALTSWLKIQRESQGITMRDLSHRLGVPHSFIGKTEQRERRLDIIEYLRYCHALEVSPIEGLKIIDPSI